MRKKSLINIGSLVVCLMLLLCSLVTTVALDDTYNIEELNLSVKVPKEYIVVTRTSDRNDSAFSDLSVSYEEKMNELKNADIYLQAISDDGVLKIDLSAAVTDSSEAVNNYSQMSSAQLKDVLDEMMTNSMYTSGVELKRNDIIFFDFKLQKDNSYGYQCHTVVNGMNINLVLQKNGEELTADEIKIVTNIASSLDFSEIKQEGKNKVEIWRFLLFIAVIAVVILLVNIIYRHFHPSGKEERARTEDKLSEQKSHTDAILASHKDEEVEKECKRSLLGSLGYGEKTEAQETDTENDEESFDQMLGYDVTDYRHRSNSQIESFDLKVKQKKRSNGVKYFEDNGEDLGERIKPDVQKGDYFDNFFNEKTEKRSSSRRFFSNIGLYIRIGFKRLGYFFTNLWRMIFPSKKLKSKSKKR